MLEKLSGTYYIDPDDMKFKDTMKHARNKVGIVAGTRHALQNCS